MLLNQKKQKAIAMTVLLISWKRSVKEVERVNGVSWWARDIF